ncbi:MAG: M14 family zinc carboxypeptidase [Planctomycetota bacterium]
MTLTIDADFPGGNILVDRIDGDDVWLRQDHRDTEGWWFYWCCRVRGAAGRTITLHFTDGNVLADRGPTISADFVDWSWADAHLEPECDEDGDFRATVRFPESHDVAYLSYSFPYVQSHLEAFLAKHAEHPHLHRSTLTTTEAGRPVEKLHLWDPQAKSLRKIMLSARRHACESVANYELEGFLEAALDPSNKILQQVEVLVVPFVDKDGVEAGDQGKNRRPHDHNRDYTGSPRYATTRAIIAELDGWADQRFDVCLDLHCPWIRGGRNDAIFLCEPPPEYQPEFDRFCRTLVEQNDSPLPFDPAANIGYGVDWNTGDEPTFGKWARDHTPARLATTIEFPYAVAAGRAVTIDRARAFGRALAHVILRWIVNRG